MHIREVTKYLSFYQQSAIESTRPQNNAVGEKQVATCILQQETKGNVMENMGLISCLIIICVQELINCITIRQ